MDLAWGAFTLWGSSDHDSAVRRSHSRGSLTFQTTSDFLPPIAKIRPGRSERAPGPGHGPKKSPMNSIYREPAATECVGNLRSDFVEPCPAISQKRAASPICRADAKRWPAMRSFRETAAQLFRSVEIGRVAGVWAIPSGMVAPRPGYRNESVGEASRRPPWAGFHAPGVAGLPFLVPHPTIQAPVRPSGSISCLTHPPPPSLSPPASTAFSARGPRSAWTWCSSISKTTIAAASAVTGTIFYWLAFVAG